MKRILLLLTCFLVFSFSATAQKESSWWIFGNVAAVEFTDQGIENRSTLPFVINANFQQQEGVGAISDDNGVLLFFCDGQNVYDRNGNIMPNGTGLDGGNSATQACIVVAAPANDDVYFLFTVGNTNNGDLSYSRVEMNLRGGLGDVTVKNEKLLLSGAEKIAATIKTGTNEAYVLGYANENTTNLNGPAGSNNAVFVFYVRGLGNRPNGISYVQSGPVTQTNNGNLPYYETTLSSTTADRGVLRLSPDGTKLAVCNQNPNAVGGGAYMYDFNASTGQVAGNGIRLDSGPAYGGEFSPSSQYFYHDLSPVQITGAPNPANIRSLIQYDLCDPANVLSSKNRFADNFSGEARGSLQLGRDGRIYVARSGYNTLGVIPDPEIDTPVYLTNAANGATDISPGICREGFPVFIQSSFKSSFTLKNQCQGEPTEFKLACLPQVVDATWDFGDGTPPVVAGPNLITHTYQNAGVYTVTVVVNNVSGDNRTFTQDITIYENGLVNDIDPALLVYCDDDASGSVSVDLSNLVSEALGAQDPADFDIKFFANSIDAQANINQLPNLFTASVGDTSIFIRIENRNAPFGDNCGEVREFTITVTGLPDVSNLPDYSLCDDPSQDGFEDFDLADFSTEIINATGAVNVSVTYYETQVDADTPVNEIDETAPYTNTTAGTQTIFVRVQSNSNADCFSVGSIELQVLEGPEIGTATDLLSCEGNEVDFTPTVAELYNGEDDQANTLTYYLSEADAINATDPLGQSYTTTVTGTPQTVTIYARLENNDTGCFTISDFDVNTEICNLEIPEGFSPNNDGINDTFTIPGFADQYPNATLQIYNRHGVQVYETSGSNYEEFAGTANKGILSGDGLLPVGTYFYVVQHNDNNLTEDIASWLYINY